MTLHNNSLSGFFFHKLTSDSVFGVLLGAATTFLSLLWSTFSFDETCATKGRFKISTIDLKKNFYHHLTKLSNNAFQTIVPGTKDLQLHNEQMNFWKLQFLKQNQCKKSCLKFIQNWPIMILKCNFT